MDPLTAVSFASNIIQFVSFARDLVSKGKEIARNADGALVENIEIESITQSIYDLNSGLVAIPTKPANRFREQPKLSKSEQELQRLSEGSKEVAEELLAALQKLKVSDGKNKAWNSFRQALNSVLSAEKIEQLSTRLERYQAQINTALLLSLRDTMKDDRGGKVTYDNRVNQELYLLSSHIQTWQYKLIKSSLQKRWDPKKEQDLHLFAAQLEGGAEIERKGLYQRRIHHSLRFAEIEERHETIADAYQKTFEWIFRGNSRPVEDENDPSSESSVVQWDDFSGWLCGEESLYWVTGKPGSGKSTLMKYLYHDSRTGDLAQGWGGSHKVIKACFFLWNSGTDMQMSFLGLLQSLLFQTVKDRLDLVSKIFPVRWQNHVMYGADLHPWTWLELNAAFKSLLAMDDLRFLIFIDGLDEFDKEPLELTSFLQDVRKIAPHNLKLCVASRPWLVFEDTFKSVPWLRLEDLTRPDIRLYIEESLAAGPRWTELSSFQPDAASKLISELASKASGVFLWVILVVQSLLNGLRDGDYVDDLFGRLNQLPSSLEDLFRKILEQLNPEYFTQACELFQLVQAGVKPLSLLTISFALEGYEASVKAKVNPIDVGELDFRADTVRRRIMSRCKGLLEAKDYRQRRHDATVQYLHRTVRDFFLSKDVEKYIQSGAPNVDAVGSLCGSYLRQVKVTAQHRSFSTVFGEFWSSFENCTMYAKEWEKKKSELPIELLDELENAGSTYWSSPSSDPDKYGSWMEEVCARWEHITDIERITGAPPALRDDQNHKIMPHWTNVCHLVDITAHQVGARRAHLPRLYTSYFDYMFETNYRSYVMAKLREKSVASKDQNESDLLVRSVRLGNFELVRALIEYGVDPNARDRKGATAWEELLRGTISDRGIEASEGLCSLFEFFLDHGADPRICVRPIGSAQLSRPVPLDDLLPQLFVNLGKQRIDSLLSKIRTAREKQKSSSRFMKTMKGVFRVRATSKG